ncbi:MAG: type II toxin-antitoxin system RelE/ParE family toxin [Bryobacteraceae bacterium]|nr:type II toxin-antitoxin system RelE/ParE family toxin [Bryobacteraceae bacterium]
MDRDTAIRLLKTLNRFLQSEVGSVKQLEGFDPPLFRLRVGAWRFIYRRQGDDTIEVLRVRNRKDAYRESVEWKRGKRWCNSLTEREINRDLVCFVSRAGSPCRLGYPSRPRLLGS